MTASASIEEERQRKRAVIETDSLAWWQTFGHIYNKSGKMVIPVANSMQAQIARARLIARREGRRFRGIVLKPRQKGLSTWNVADFYHFLSTQTGTGLIVGGAHFQGERLWKMLKTYAENDQYFGAGKGCLGANPATVTEDHATWLNNSEALRQTAANPNAARSGTFQYIIATEYAYWAKEGVKNAKRVLSDILACVPNTAETCVMLESTANGVGGDFYDRYQSAIPLDRWEAGEDGYIRFFAAWFDFDDSALPLIGDERKRLEDTLSHEETTLQERYGVTLEQLAWRRVTIAEECSGSSDLFNEKYPSDEVSAFLSSGRRRFSQSKILEMRDRATAFPARFGILEEKGAAVGLRECGQNDAMWWVWEKPLPGRAYLVAVDTAEGETKTVVDDPDHHAILVLRQGYHDDRGWHPPAVVAAAREMIPSMEGNLLEPGCRWDQDVMEREVIKISKMFGTCLVVPERNADRGLIRKLQESGIPVYEHQDWNRRDQVFIKKLGWQTSAETRPVMIESLAVAIRTRGVINGGLDVWCPWTIQQLLNFTIINGRAAGEGEHDDQVMGLAIGFQCLPWATPFSAGRVMSPVEAELLRMNGGARRRSQWS